MRALYVFPHPDDESFGPGVAMVKQAREGHEVHLLTLTKGGATKERHRLGYSIEQMGEVRAKEMEKVAEVMGLKSLNVMDFPDNGLKDLDPRDLEEAIDKEIQNIRPHVVITFAAHGVSGFIDHLVGYAVLKRVYVEAKQKPYAPQRLALFTITEERAKHGYFHLTGTKESEILCIETGQPSDVETVRKALDCYETYRDVIEKTQIKKQLEVNAHFELFQENPEKILTSIFDGLRE